MDIQAYDFPITMGQIPRDHGYPVFSGLTAQHPFLHGRGDVQIAPIRGTRRGDILKMDRKSVLHIRGISPEEANLISGSWFDVQDSVLLLGRATPKEITPTQRLVSRLVVLRDAVQENDFLRVLGEILPIQATVRLGKQQATKIKGRTMIGHTVHLKDMNPEDSLLIQGRGLGWGTSMGCGVFYPGTLS